MTNLYPNISLYGAPGVGKTTAAMFLTRLGYQRVSFAGSHKGGLRDIVMRIWGEEARNDRPKLNAIGMAARAADPDAWVNPLLRELDKRNQVIIDDMRGDNEWFALRARGFVMVHLTAPAAQREERLRRNGKLEGSDMAFLWGLEDTERYHPDHVVENGGSQDELFAALTDILNLERRKRA